MRPRRLNVMFAQCALQAKPLVMVKQYRGAYYASVKLRSKAAGWVLSRELKCQRLTIVAQFCNPIRYGPVWARVIERVLHQEVGRRGRFCFSTRLPRAPNSPPPSLDPREAQGVAPNPSRITSSVNRHSVHCWPLSGNAGRFQAAVTFPAPQTVSVAGATDKSTHDFGAPMFSRYYSASAGPLEGRPFGATAR